MDLPRLEGRYSNFLKVGYNALEMVLEFGQLYGESSEEIIHTRIVTTAPYAKAFCELLTTTLQELVEKYGPIAVHNPTEQK